MTAAADRPLAGTRVIDFSVTLPGPYTTHILRQLGAEVIKVERPASGDPARDYAFYPYLNAGKRSVALDLKSTEDASAAAALVATADVLVEGFRPGVMARLGLGSDTLLARHPRLVYCSLSGFGSAGSQAAGHDLTYCALAGLLQLNRDVDGHLVLATPVPRVADIGGALNAAIAILARLHQRSLTGQGGRVDISLFAASLAFNLLDIARALRSTEELSHTESAQLPHYRLFETADGRHLALAIAREDERFWANFCDAVGLDTWRDTTADIRTEHRDELAAVLEAVFAARSLDDWAEVLDRADVQWAPVISPAEAVARQPGGDEVFSAGAFRYPLGLGLELETPATATLGEDTAEVLASLGLPPQR